MPAQQRCVPVAGHSKVHRAKAPRPPSTIRKQPLSLLALSAAAAARPGACSARAACGCSIVHNGCCSSCRLANHFLLLLPLLLLLWHQRVGLLCTCRWCWSSCSWCRLWCGCCCWRLQLWFCRRCCRCCLGCRPPQARCPQHLPNECQHKDGWCKGQAGPPLEELWSLPEATSSQEEQQGTWRA